MRTVDKLALAAFSAAFILGAARLPDGTALASAAELSVAVATALVSVAAATPFALALARLHFEGKALMFTLLILATATTPDLLTPADPSTASKFLNDLALGVPIAVWIIYLVARAFPPELEDAALLDGSTRYRVWLPLIRPAVMAAAPLVFLYCAFDLVVR